MTKRPWLWFRSSVPVCHHRVRHAYTLISHLTCFVEGFDFENKPRKNMDILDNLNLRTKCCHQAMCAELLWPCALHSLLTQSALLRPNNDAVLADAQR